MQLTAAEIARLTGGTIEGNPGTTVTGVAGIREAEPGEVSFVAHAKYLPACATTRACEGRPTRWGPCSAAGCRIPAFVPGGFTTTPPPERITKFKAYVAELIAFIDKTYLPDVDLLERYYGSGTSYAYDYAKIGRGRGNLLAYGVFDLDNAGQQKLLKSGQVVNGSTAVQPLDVNAITEQVIYSWYDNRTNNLAPASGATTPQYPKSGAYSWLKAPRYQEAAYEAGPLARMWVNGDYQYGISVLDRHHARAREAQKVAYALRQWVDQLNPSGPVYQPYATPATATSIAGA